MHNFSVVICVIQLDFEATDRFLQITLSRGSWRWLFVEIGSISTCLLIVLVKLLIGSHRLWKLPAITVLVSRSQLSWRHWLAFVYSWFGRVGWNVGLDLSGREVPLLLNRLLASYWSWLLRAWSGSIVKWPRRIVSFLIGKIFGHSLILISSLSLLR